MNKEQKNNDLAQKVCDWVINRNPTNLELVQIIELLGNFADIKSISQYAKDSELSYNGVKKTRNIIELFGNKYVVEL